ncbi:hypothetical protein A7X67_04320 [Clostridium sp. W14A]|nr:hypothetical protein A7X67_04320 [Clostridium sp. W14A]
MQKVVSALLFLLLGIVTAPSVKADAVIKTIQIPKINSEAAILMDATSGQILFQKNIDQKMYPASITKIMTGMLALKKGKLTDVITMSNNAVFSVDRDSSHIALDVGEKITLEQALYATSIESANDAANGIAELIGGSLVSFSKMMNDTAAQVGANNTKFINSNGLHSDNHYTTAYDMAKITAAAIKVPGFLKIFAAKHYEIPPTNKQPATRVFSSRNKLINGEVPYNGILMSKTGWTSEAQHTLVTAAQKDGTTLIAVVMKSSNTNDKWKDTVDLLNYGFTQFSSVEIANEKLIQSAPKMFTLANNTLASVVYDTSGTVPILLPVNLTLDDLSFKYGKPNMDTKKNPAQIPVCISLNKSYSSSIPVEILDTKLSFQINSERKPPTPEGKSTAVSSGEKGKWFLLIPFAILVGVAYFILKRRYATKRKY